MVDVFFTRFNNALPTDIYNKYLSELPVYLQDKNNRLARWPDKHANLFGILLLKNALKYYNYPINILSDIKYTENNRPFIDIFYDFNISHSGEYIVCAVSERQKIGIDVEFIKPIEIEAFKNVFTSGQLREILNAPDPLSTFYEFWVRKESMIKADGRGFSLLLDTLEITNNKIIFENTCWHLFNLPINSGYKCSVSTKNENSTFRYWYLNFYSIEEMKFIPTSTLQYISDKL